MKDTSVQTGPLPAAKAEVRAAAPPAVTSAPRRSPTPWPLRALKALASLKLTVVLFVLSIILVFCGTLAQIDKGIWTVVHEYFRSFMVWIPLYIFFPREWKGAGGLLGWVLGWKFPYPGGWLLGSLLLVNLLAAHLTRFKVSWKRSGILLTHAGLIAMMLGELITGLFAVESRMSIPTGLSSNFIENNDAVELAVLSPTEDRTDDVAVVPAGLLRKGGVIHHDDLPFDIEVRKYMPNSAQPVAPEKGADTPADQGDGRFYVTEERPEGTGVDPEQREDMASAYVTFKDKASGKPLGTYLVSTWLYRLSTHPYQQVKANNKTYDVALRYRREYQPYTVHLYKFTHAKYDGTDVPKDFASTVQLTDPSRDQDFQVVIRMNEPLRYEGETFYQIGFLPDDSGTTLQVVRNPGWLMPYVSCVMVGLGLAIHFGMSLVRFLVKRAAQ
jgi:hypothetical protein